MTVHELMIRLDEAGLHYTLAHIREDEAAVMFQVAVPGELWEAEVFPDGHVELEVFKSDGMIHEEEQLIARIQQFAE